MALANFGTPRYGGSLMGRLVYVDKDYGMDYNCSTPCRYSCQDFSKATPSLDFYGDRDAIVLLVDRGPVGPNLQPCKFAEKVWNAQRAGARAVLVANYEDRLTTMEAPDGDDEADHAYLANITVPASFITRTSADALRAMLRDKQAVHVSLDWTDVLPKQRKVDWEFWTNSNDQCGAVCDVQKQFIKEFVPVAEEFDGAGWTSFTPHYLVWDCPTAYHNSRECQARCIRHGRYCAPDPDGDLWAGYSGAQVVAENLRSLCVHQLAAAAGRPYLWWDYVTRYGDSCDMESGRYGEACAEKTFESINGDGWSSLSALRACVGDPALDAPSELLDSQRRGQSGDEGEGEVFIVPTIRINGGQYRGRMATPDVMRAICAGFLEGNRPAACDRLAGDACVVGGAGATACAARGDGKTACVTTFAGYNCTCGPGFLPRPGAADGDLVCMDINECLSVTSLETNCTCPRCACRNTYGGYQCIPDLADECAASNGGCWEADLSVGDAKQHFTACHDNIQEYKAAMAKEGNTMLQLHTCTCPPCFTATAKGCTPKCDLWQCDAALGACVGAHSGGGVSVATLAGTVVLVTALLAAAGLVAYKLRFRHMMQAEVRAIMAEYMPLAETEAPGVPLGSLPVRDGAPRGLS